MLECEWSVNSSVFAPKNRYRASIEDALRQWLNWPSGRASHEDNRKLSRWKNTYYSYQRV